MGSHHHHNHGATPAEYPVLNPKSGAKWSKGLTADRLNNFGE